MVKIVYVELTFDGIEQLLRDAAKAHRKAKGKTQDDWAKWYAEYIWGKTAEDHKIIDTEKDTRKVSSLQLKTEVFSEYIDEEFDEFETSEKRMMDLIDG